MLDVHPEPGHPWVEVRVGEDSHLIGQLDTSVGVQKINAARAVLSSVLDAQYFVRELTRTFEFSVYHESVDEWLAYMAENWTDAVIPPAIVDRARALLIPGAGTLRVSESVYAARLRRLATR